MKLTKKKIEELAYKILDFLTDRGFEEDVCIYHYDITLDMYSSGLGKYAIEFRNLFFNMYTIEEREKFYNMYKGK